MKKYEHNYSKDLILKDTKVDEFFSISYRNSERIYKRTEDGMEEMMVKRKRDQDIGLGIN